MALSLVMYADENNGRFTPRGSSPRWPNLLKSGYRDVKVLRCPTDIDPKTTETGSTLPEHVDADRAPRSYIINGWNEYFRATLGAGSDYLTSNNKYAIRDSAILHPSDTIVFGEKDPESTHYFMDWDQRDDYRQLDESKHMSGLKKENGDGGGGSNYAFADGSARYLRFEKSVLPINLWFVFDTNRLYQSSF